MKLSLRILLGYFLIVGLAAYVVLNVFRDEVKPGVRQAMEETLVDTANILAELAAADLKAGRIGHGAFAQAVSAAVKREVHADIWGIQKQKLDYRVYVTDAQGIVVFDSEGKALGEDYSRWNDVHRTLQGQYGARSSKLSPYDDSSSVMHIAAPIKAGEKIIGVLTIARPNANLQPFVDRSQQKIRNWGLALLAASAAIGLFFTWRLTRSLNRLRRYARDVAEGRKTPLPESGNTEIAELGRALEAMRERLEGKQYIEQYVHTLTHELKSPVAAIQGAAELLDEEMPRPARATFLANIREQ
ncbi:MAG TPA: two-component system sensor histidine kinase CreC, partial [Rhodocyclaceae bacterium]|nr:two-component system sensor histidine kinase CreC [Rhodocyclaceae bacterium]